VTVDDAYGATHAALTAPIDRTEMADILVAERMRRRVLADSSLVGFGIDRRESLDAPYFVPDVGDARAQTVGSWAATSAVSAPFGRILYRIARALGGNILEVGTGSGVSAAYLASGSARSKQRGELISIELNPVLARRAALLLRETLGSGATRIVRADQGDYFDVLLDRLKPRIIHIDSDHTYLAAAQLIRRVLSLHRSTVLCLDDIRWSEGMERLWDEIRGSDHVGTHLFDFGLCGVVVIDPLGGAVPSYERLAVPAYLSGAVALAER
jgi:predicted O-methyltransferase YrrM